MMGFGVRPNKPAPRPRFKGIPRDEKLVRKAMQRSFHRRAGESWRDSWLRIRAIHRSRVGRWLKKGIINQNLADRLLRCDSPNNKEPKRFRRYCNHPSCPACLYRLRLATMRSVYHEMVVPELVRQRQAPRNKKPKTRLVMGQVEIIEPSGEDVDNRVQARLAEINRRLITRQVCRYGKISDGFATTTFHRHGDGSVSIRIAVVGLTDVTPHLRTGPATKSLCIGADRPPAEVQWRAATRGHNCPVWGPLATLRLVAAALPSVNDNGAIKAQRFRPLGRCRGVISARPRSFPKPIKTQATSKGYQRCWQRNKVDQLSRYVGRQVIRAVGKTVGVYCPNVVIGRFFRRLFDEWYATYGSAHVDLPSLCEKLMLPVHLETYAYEPQRHSDFLPPPENGGKQWNAIIKRLRIHRDGKTIFAADSRFAMLRRVWITNDGSQHVEFNVTPPTTMNGLTIGGGGDPDGVLVMRPPGMDRGAVVIHDCLEARKYGKAHQIGDSRYCAQDLGCFLDWAIDMWPECTKPKTFGDLWARA